MRDQTTAAGGTLQNILDAWFDAWNANDLDRVMTFFAEDAVCRPGDGSEHRGKVAIRRAFEPQFRGALGTMRFDELDRLVDEVSRKVATFSYGGYKRHPLLLKQLGVPLAARV